ncbi:hypothetical protein B0J13DRAFT_413143, partial [Dactylonectria estremocensis]
MPPPAPQESFATWEDAFQYAQNHAKRHGYAVVKKRSSNRENGVPRRQDLSCACSGSFTDKSTGKREGSSRKTECPFKLKIVQRKVLGDRWFLDVMCGNHNHLSDHPDAFPEHRKLTPRELDEVHLQSEEMNFTARSVLLSLRANNPNTLVTEQDIYNIQSAQRE